MLYLDCYPKGEQWKVLSMLVISMTDIRLADNFCYRCAGTSFCYRCPGTQQLIIAMYVPGHFIDLHRHDPHHHNTCMTQENNYLLNVCFDSIEKGYLEPISGIPFNRLASVLLPMTLLYTSGLVVDSTKRGARGIQV